VEGSKLSVIPNAVAITHDDRALGALRDQKRESLGIGEAELVIGYLGRLSGEKGLRFLIDAVHELADELPMKLLIVGDGPQQSELEEIVDSLGLSDRVVFAGFQTDPEAWLPAFDVSVLPSLTEGTPVALLEAMAARVPLIATNVGGVPQVIADGTNGLLVPAGDAWALSVAIRTLIRDPELMRRLAAAGLETVRTRYGLDSWCRRLEEQYCSLLAAGA
jgi:glycosyltransferase involved in cell wall biosynthesis